MDDQGKVAQSLGYEDYGLTRIQGQSAAASFDGMTSFYRFQDQEQEVFPLAKLGIEDVALAQWLDQIQLYHFPWRDYAAGLASFTQTNPIPRDDSLYAALGANPVNYTDETGGMFQPPETVLDSIDAETQQLLDRVEAGDYASISSQEIVKLFDLSARVAVEKNQLEEEVPKTSLALARRIHEMSMRVLLDAGVVGRASLEEYRRAKRHPDTVEVRRKWDLFNLNIEHWLENYNVRREAWLDRYASAIDVFEFLRFGKADDEDEKDDGPSEALNRFLKDADADSDNGLMNDSLADGDAQNVAPVHPVVQSEPHAEPHHESSGHRQDELEPQ
jgi:RHS repeat-associated protein